MTFSHRISKKGGRIPNGYETEGTPFRGTDWYPGKSCNAGRRLRCFILPTAGISWVKVDNLGAFLQTVAGVT